jgi:hypothetical protein
MKINSLVLNQNIKVVVESQLVSKVRAEHGVDAFDNLAYQHLALVPFATDEERSRTLLAASLGIARNVTWIWNPFS